jgi:hypothetical protein
VDRLKTALLLPRKSAPRDEVLSHLRRAMTSAGAAIFDAAQSDPDLSGMGTTLTAMLFYEGRVFVTHVGDSRAYLYRDGRAQQLTDELVICTTGYTCRDMQAVSDRPANFYMIGSMGNAASLGLGIALAQPHRRVVVLDGDGSVLMGLGVLAMVGSLRPRNLVHMGLDNEVFASTGKQPTSSRDVALDEMAALAGYPIVHRATTPEEVTGYWRQIQTSTGSPDRVGPVTPVGPVVPAGPVFLLVKCLPDDGPPMERVQLSPEAVMARFMGAVGK